MADPQFPNLTPNDEIFKGVPEEQAQKITSDIETEVKETGALFLEEPTKPERLDYNNEENYKFAMEQYREKLLIYTARVQYLKNIKKNKEAKGIEYPDYNYFCPIINDQTGEREPFKPAKVAIWLATEDHFKTDEKTDILYWGDAKTGLWTKEGETALRKIVTKILGEHDKESHYKNILYTLKSLTYTNPNFSIKLACDNGLLDVETTNFSPFNLDEMVFYRIPITYNPNIDKSKLENWLKFLNQVAKPDDIPLLQEWFGYCLLPDYRFHKALWIHGEGRNGKGVFDRTIKGILGPDNYSTVGLERLDGSQRFVLKDLYGKLYNSSSEPMSNKIFQVELFQKLTGGDAVDAEFKGINKEKRFVSAAKQTIIGNKFPKIINPTQAFKDRMLFVKFENHFNDKQQIPNLERLWLNDPEQKTAIFNWALEGLQRLLKQGHFSTTKTQEETQIMFNRVTDNVTAFIMECGKIDKNLTTTRSEVLEAYQQYCEEMGLEQRKPTYLTQALQKLAPKVKDGWIYKPKKERAWIGFGLLIREQQFIDQPMEQMEQMEQQNIPSYIFEKSKKIEENKSAVPTVLSVPNKEQVILKTGDSGLKRLEVNPDFKPQPSVCSSLQGEKVHYLLLSENDSDTHKCCKCEGLQAEYKVTNPSNQVFFVCQDCFHKYRCTFEPQGVKFLDDTMPDYGEEF